MAAVMKRIMVMVILGITLGIPPPAHADEVPYETTPAVVVDATTRVEWGSNMTGHWSR
jgi:hypothetical protein